MNILLIGNKYCGDKLVALIKKSGDKGDRFQKRGVSAPNPVYGSESLLQLGRTLVMAVLMWVMGETCRKKSG